MNDGITNEHLQKAAVTRYQHKYLLKLKAGLSEQVLGILAWHYLPFWPWPVLMSLFPRALLFSRSPAGPSEDAWLRYGTRRSCCRVQQQWGLSGSWCCGKWVSSAMEVICQSQGTLGQPWIFIQRWSEVLSLYFICSHCICNYMVKIDGQWVQTLFYQKCNQSENVWFHSSWDYLEDFLIFSGSVLILRLLFSPSSFCLWNKKTKIKKEENSQLHTITVVLAKFKECHSRIWNSITHLQGGQCNPVPCKPLSHLHCVSLRGTVASDWDNSMKSYLLDRRFSSKFKDDQSPEGDTLPWCDEDQLAM